jgi:hypothetical protein
MLNDFSKIDSNDFFTMPLTKKKRIEEEQVEDQISRQDLNKSKF